MGSSQVKTNFYVKRSRSSTDDRRVRRNWLRLSKLEPLESRLLYAATGAPTITSLPAALNNPILRNYITAMEGTRNVAYDDATGLPVQPGVPVQGNITVGIGSLISGPNGAATLQGSQKISAVFGTNVNSSNYVSYAGLLNGTVTLSPTQIQQLFNYDLYQQYQMAKGFIPNLDGLSIQQETAVVDVAFQLSNAGFKNLEHGLFVSDVNAGDWYSAGLDLQASGIAQVRGNADAAYLLDAQSAYSGSAILDNTIYNWYAHLGDPYDYTIINDFAYGTISWNYTITGTFNPTTRTVTNSVTGTATWAFTEYEDAVLDDPQPGQSPFVVYTFNTVRTFALSGTPTYFSGSLFLNLAVGPVTEEVIFQPDSTGLVDGTFIHANYGQFDISYFQQTPASSP